MTPAPSPDRLDALLDGAVDWVAEHGLATLSLRPLARALGTSDRMLIYYFGSKDALVAAVVGRAAERLRADFEQLASRSGDGSATGLVDGLWQVLTAPEAAPTVTLFLELFALARRHGEPYRAAAGAVTDQWLGLMRTATETLGVPPERSGEVAVGVAAQLDGLLLLHAAGVDEATLRGGRRLLAAAAAQAAVEPATSDAPAPTSDVPAASGRPPSSRRPATGDRAGGETRAATERGA